MKISQESLQTAWENQRLVRGAVKVAHVYSRHEKYEDIITEGIIIYAQMLDKYADKSEKEINRLAFQKIIWFAQDEMRKSKYRNEHHTDIDTADQLMELNNLDNLDLAVRDYVATLSEVEQLIFYEHLIYQASLLEIAQIVHESRRNLQRKRNRLIEKIRKLF